MRWEEQRRAMQQDSQAKAQLAQVRGTGWTSCFCCLALSRRKPYLLLRCVAWAQQNWHHLSAQRDHVPSAQYNDELARKRMATEQEALRQRNAELVNMQVRCWTYHSTVQMDEG